MTTTEEESWWRGWTSGSKEITKGILVLYCTRPAVIKLSQQHLLLILISCLKTVYRWLDALLSFYAKFPLSCLPASTVSLLLSFFIALNFSLILFFFYFSGSTCFLLHKTFVHIFLLKGRNDVEVMVVTLALKKETNKKEEIHAVKSILV